PVHRVLNDDGPPECIARHLGMATLAATDSYHVASLTGEGDQGGLRMIRGACDLGLPDDPRTHRGQTTAVLVLVPIMTPFLTAGAHPRRRPGGPARARAARGPSLRARRGAPSQRGAATPPTRR